MCFCYYQRSAYGLYGMLEIHTKKQAQLPVFFYWAFSSVSSRGDSDNICFLGHHYIRFSYKTSSPQRIVYLNGRERDPSYTVILSRSWSRTRTCFVERILFFKTCIYWRQIALSMHT